MRAIAIAATAVMCAACAGHDQQSDGVAAPNVTPAGIAAQGTDANAVGDPQRVTTAQGTDANAAGDPQPVPNTLCARIAAAASNFELQCNP